MSEHDETTTTAWRAEVRAFLDAHARLRTGIDDWSAQPTREDAAAAAEYFRRCRQWQQTVFDNGFAGITWPVEHGLPRPDGTADVPSAPRLGRLTPAAS